MHQHLVTIAREVTFIIMDKIREMAIEFGFEGEELKQFVKEQDAFLRAERIAERELERDRLAAEKEKQDRELERDRLAAEKELERDRLAAEKEKQDRELERDRLAAAQQEREIELEKAKLEQEVELARIESLERQNDKDRESKLASEVEIEKMKAEKATYARNPKLPYFEEAKDKMDSYLARFEKYTIVNKWDPSLWSTYLSALLKCRALEVYDRMAVSDAADYAKLKDALLKNFDMTERGFRKKFRYEKPERSETFVQFSSGLRSYLNKWINMAKIEESYEAICDFMARDQFLESCNRELYVHLKPKTFKNLDEMAKEADLFAEARGGVHTCVNRGQRDNRGAAPSQNKTGASRPSGKPEIKCNNLW